MAWAVVREFAAARVAAGETIGPKVRGAAQPYTTGAIGESENF